LENARVIVGKKGKVWEKKPELEREHSKKGGISRSFDRKEESQEDNNGGVARDEKRNAKPSSISPPAVERTKMEAECNSHRDQKVTKRKRPDPRRVNESEMGRPGYEADPEIRQADEGKF